MTVFVLIAFVCTIGFLILGITSMVRGGEFDRTHGTRYMALRVAMQTAAFVLVLLALQASLQ